MGLADLIGDIHIRDGVGVDVPVDELWRGLTWPDRVRMWNPRLASMEWDGEGRSGRAVIRGSGGESLYRLSVEEPDSGSWPRVLVMELEQGPWWLSSALMRFYAEPTGQLSRVLYQGRYRVRPFLIRRLASAILSGVDARMLAKLKETLESARPKALP